MPVPAEPELFSDLFHFRWISYYFRMVFAHLILHEEQRAS